MVANTNDGVDQQTKKKRLTRIVNMCVSDYCESTLLCSR